MLCRTARTAVAPKEAKAQRIKETEWWVQKVCKALRMVQSDTNGVQTGCARAVCNTVGTSRTIRYHARKVGAKSVQSGRPSCRGPQAHQQAPLYPASSLVTQQILIAFVTLWTFPFPLLSQNSKLSPLVPHSTPFAKCDLNFTSVYDWCESCPTCYESCAKRSKLHQRCQSFSKGVVGALVALCRTNGAHS